KADLSGSAADDHAGSSGGTITRGRDLDIVVEEGSTDEPRPAAIKIAQVPVQPPVVAVRDDVVLELEDAGWTSVLGDLDAGTHAVGYVVEAEDGVPRPAGDHPGPAAV